MDEQVPDQRNSNGPTSMAAPWTRGAPSTSVVRPVLFGEAPASITVGAALPTLSR